MCMQHIWAATYIGTFDEIFNVLKKYMHVGTISKRNIKNSIPDNVAS